MLQHLTVRYLDKPRAKNHREDLSWFCDSLGFCSGRDVHSMAFAIVDALLSRQAQATSSEAIAEDLRVTASRVNHHIRNLMDSGFLYREKRHVHLRGGSLKAAVEEMRKDTNRIFDELGRMAEELDAAHGIKNR
ncbi:ArsR family transcriptional regulator [Candidatus Woesearchaeota archaeon]|nr:ArsR family transcriptional regulator [Candidatus Woesearchaeota archaeon]